jgi:hypothetical protein
MKNLFLLSYLLLSTLLQGQIFNRSKAGTLPAIPLQLGNTLYTISSNSIDEIDESGNTVQSQSLPFLNNYRASKTVLRKANGNFLIFGSFQAGCDIFANLGYFAYEYSPQLVLIDSTHQQLNNVATFLQALELSQSRYFILTENGYLLLNASLDTLVKAMTPNLAQLNRAIYLGGDEVLIYSQTWASSTPLFHVLDLATGALSPWTGARHGEITSLSDSTFALVNLPSGDLFRYQKSNQAYIDSSRLMLSTSFSASQFQELSDGFVLKGDSGLSVYNKVDLSVRGSYLAKQPLNRGLLSVAGNQLFFCQQNGTNITNYHVLEAGELNQAASTIVEGLVLKIKNTSLAPTPHSSGVANLYQVNATWEITLVNNSIETIDSTRILWADPSGFSFCGSLYSALPLSANGLALGDSVILSFPMVYFSVYAPNGDAFLAFRAGVVMANGKVVSEEGNVTVSAVINNISLGELSPLAALNLFPNPASTFIFIDAPRLINKVDILNLQGQSIRDFAAQDGLQQISVEGLAKGIYWVQLQSKNMETMRRILVE